MAAMDFPASPTDGQVYGNYVWSASTGAWLSKGVTQTTAVTSDVAPSNPKAGDMWYNSTDGVMYLYYNDGNTSQWVQFKNDASFSSTLGPRVDSLDANANTNYIINGAFDIWQRGTSFTSPSNGAYCPDRWAFFQDGSGATKIVSQQAHTPGAAPVAGYEYPNYLKINQTVAGSGGTYNSFIQRIEDVRTLAGQTVTLSFWARTSSSSSFGTVYLLQNFGSGGSTSVGTNLTSSVALTSGWTRYTYTATLPSLAGKTIGSSSYLEVGFYLPLNATFNIDFWGAQLQAGAIATSFHRAASTLQGELAACQRYYWRWTADALYNRFAMGNGYNTTQVVMWIPNPVKMRGIPSSIDANLLTVWDGAALNGTASSLSFDSAGSAGSSVFVNGLTSITATRAYQLLANGSTSAYIGMNAEL